MRAMTSDALVRLTSLALERTALLLAEAISAHHESSLPPPRCFTCIAYAGPEEGRLVLAASDGFVRQLAGGMVGVDPTEVHVASAGLDALRELTTIVAGGLLAELGGAGTPLVLGLPVSCTASEVPSSAACTALLSAAGERLEIHWCRDRVNDIS